MNSPRIQGAFPKLADELLQAHSPATRLGRLRPTEKWCLKKKISESNLMGIFLVQHPDLCRITSDVLPLQILRKMSWAPDPVKETNRGNPTRCWDKAPSFPTGEVSVLAVSFLRAAFTPAAICCGYSSRAGVFSIIHDLDLFHGKGRTMKFKRMFGSVISTPRMPNIS